MRNRIRHATLIALAAALLVVGASAQAAAVKVQPTASVLTASKSGKYARFTIDVKFPIPLGATAADCTGKIIVSTKLSKKKTAKWSGKLSAVGTSCTAKIKAKLAAIKYGKKLKFKVVYKGSKKLKPFVRNWKLKIVTPSPTQTQPPVEPAAPTPPPLDIVGVHNKGNWDINAIEAGNDDFEFLIEPDYSVNEIFSTAGGEVQLQCETSSPQASITFNTGFLAKLDNITVQSTQTDAFFNSMVHTFHFSWTSPTGGVGQYSSSGEYNVGTTESPDFEQCTGGFNFTLEHFVPLP